MELIVDRQALVNAARQARSQAYAPYSNFAVGAALLTADGTIHQGCNVENASYPVGICAERTAMSRAVADGHREFVAIAIVTENGSSPCGMCRQFMNEFAPDLIVLLADSETITGEFTLEELLPHAFGPENLPG